MKLKVDLQTGIVCWSNFVDDGDLTKEPGSSFARTLAPGGQSECVFLSSVGDCQVRQQNSNPSPCHSSDQFFRLVSEKPIT